MLKTMDELEKAVNKLLQRVQGRPETVPGPERGPSGDGNTKADLREHEAAELIRRAIKRLRSL